MKSLRAFALLKWRLTTPASRRILLGLLAALLPWPVILAATLEVGPGKRFHRIEQALEASKPGDEILVHPRADGKPYVQAALLVRTARLEFRAAKGPRDERVAIDGNGFD